MPYLVPPLGYADWSEADRVEWCEQHGGHEPYTHRHAGEADTTFCLRCRLIMRGEDGS